MTDDYYEVDLQKLRDSDFPEIIKAEVQDFITWNFNEALFELSTLFNILERGVIFRVIDGCRDLSLRDTNLREICLCYENIAERLLNEEYKLLALVFPNNLYMKCINSLVFNTDRPCNETCWFHILPRQIRFHITYYQHLMWYVDSKYTKSTVTLDN